MHFHPDLMFSQKETEKEKRRGSVMVTALPLESFFPVGTGYGVKGCVSGSRAHSLENQTGLQGKCSDV